MFLKISAPASSVVIWKISSNRGLLNSKIHLTCLLNSCLQLLQMTTIPMFLLGMQKLEVFLHNYLTLSLHKCIPHKELSPVQAESLNIHN